MKLNMQDHADWCLSLRQRRLNERNCALQPAGENGCNVELHMGIALDEQ
jgi:hypothetical protein